MEHIMKISAYRIVVASTVFAVLACSKSKSPTAITPATRSATSIGVSNGHLVDANGLAVYDTPVACTGTCLTVWPPVVASQVPTATGGASAAALALSAGQVTYNGHLLFYFQSDTTAGQTGGSGVNGFALVAP
jgi:predicted lipoprotein with Yx(FWY)xxD motif